MNLLFIYRNMRCGLSHERESECFSIYIYIFIIYICAQTLFFSACIKIKLVLFNKKEIVKQNIQKKTKIRDILFLFHLLLIIGVIVLQAKQTSSINIPLFQNGLFLVFTFTLRFFFLKYVQQRPSSNSIKSRYLPFHNRIWHEAFKPTYSFLCASLGETNRVPICE